MRGREGCIQGERGGEGIRLDHQHLHSGKVISGSYTFASLNSRLESHKEEEEDEEQEESIFFQNPRKKITTKVLVL